MPRTNLLFVFGDEHRGQAIGCRGNPDVQTPVLDQFASEGVLFTHAYANTPVCTPSRGTLLTGQWPLRHGAVSNDLPVQTGDETPSIARALTTEGYRCGYIGKWHVGGWPRDRFTPPGPERLGFDDLWAAWECHHDYMVPKYYLNDSPEPIVLHDRYEPEVQTDIALSWLEEQTSNGSSTNPPFCLIVSYGPPHRPYRPVPPGMERTYDPDTLSLRPNCVDMPGERRDLADYYAHITALDGELGRLVAFLRDRGDLDNTLVVYSSDHGTMLGSQGHHNKQRPWEESINVPLVMRFGDRLGRGSRSDLLIGLLDYAPTLLGLLGVGVPRSMEGRDLSAYILDADTAGRPDAVYLAELICCDEAVRVGIAPWRGVRTRSHTYARSLNGPWVLYDNETDPYQLRNLVHEPATRRLLAEMEAALHAWMMRLEDPLVSADDVLDRLDLTDAWSAREAHFHPTGWPPPTT